MMDTATTVREEQKREELRQQQRQDMQPENMRPQDTQPEDMQPEDTRTQQPEPGNAEARAALFAPDAAGDFRSRWDAVQIAFVDDPVKAVRDADELVNQVLKSLADSFGAQRAAFDGDRGPSTEDLRVALRRYRAFFERLLSL